MCVSQYSLWPRARGPYRGALRCSTVSGYLLLLLLLLFPRAVLSPVIKLEYGGGCGVIQKARISGEGPDVEDGTSGQGQPRSRQQTISDPREGKDLGPLTQAASLPCLTTFVCVCWDETCAEEKKNVCLSPSVHSIHPFREKCKTPACTST